MHSRLERQVALHMSWGVPATLRVGYVVKLRLPGLGFRCRVSHTLLFRGQNLTGPGCHKSSHSFVVRDIECGLL